MQDRKIYEKSLSDYPDLLTTEDLSKALGGLCNKTIRNILKRGEIIRLRDGNRYLLPKESVIDFMLSDSYKRIMQRKMLIKQTVELERDMILHRKRLLEFCYTPRSKKEMMLFLNLSSVKIFYRLFLDPLLETGELRPTIKNRTSINALVAADSVIIPSQPSFLSTKGLGLLLKSVTKVRRAINPRLAIDGILLTMVDRRTNNANEIISSLRESIGRQLNIFSTEIPRSVRAAEASVTGGSIFEYDKNGKVALAYEQLAKEVLGLEERSKDRPRTDWVR